MLFIPIISLPQGGAQFPPFSFNYQRRADSTGHRHLKRALFLPSRFGPQGKLNSSVLIKNRFAVVGPKSPFFKLFARSESGMKGNFQILTRALFWKHFTYGLRVRGRPIFKFFQVSFMAKFQS